MRSLVFAFLAFATFLAAQDRPALAQAANTCAALDPTRGGAAATGVEFVSLNLEIGDVVTLFGVSGQLLVITPGEGSATATLPADFVFQAAEASLTFIAATSGLHHLGSEDPGGGGTLAPGSFTCTSNNTTTQQKTSTTVMTREMGNSIYAGVSNAIAERFVGGYQEPPGLIVKGYAASGHVSLLGLSAKRERDLKRKLQLASQAPWSDEESAAEWFGAIDTGETDNQLGGAATPFFGWNDSVDDGSQPDRLNAWARGSFSYIDGDALSGQTWNGIAGIDYLVTDDLLIGVLGGYESGDFEFDFDVTDGDFEGDGFTAGAYVGLLWSDSLLIDAFIAHSWLDYDNVAGTATGSTDGSRVLMAMNLTGSHQITNNLIIEPNARAFYAHESQDAYVMSNGLSVDKNTLNTGRLSAGPRFRHLFSDGSGNDWSILVSAHAEYDLSSEDQENNTLPGFDGVFSGRFGTGLEGQFLNGWLFSLGGEIGGVGTDDLLSYTGTGRIRIPLN